MKFTITYKYDRTSNWPFEAWTLLDGHNKMGHSKTSFEDAKRLLEEELTQMVSRVSLPIPPPEEIEIVGKDEVTA